ncbi:hypothetical protein BZA05DRAFT_242102 [Tricharina praecox]|uniref:uncharacterized protein n=1 Tax=Tricharina praecox TaxID=43433 RepID=UPI00221F1F33|nr:uncharacterized protein BZA05DRAFT_242102 [Tricharina praecox]KAI5840905.1 hypothetical protein BZA05DRAFT_242102 [Tricharina praecox]
MDALGQLRWLLNRGGQRRAALYGLGGVGKTTIAVDFCHQRKKLQPDDHIFWVHCDSHEAFKHGYLEIGCQADILGDPGATRGESGLMGVKNWLDNPASGNWTMVIDNFDEVDSYPTRYLPVDRGAILFTTRDGTLVGNPAGYVPTGAGVDVNEMSGSEAMEMLSKLLGLVGTDASLYSSAAFKHINILQKLPLAIAQAAACIRATRMTIPDYLELFQRCDRHQHELLEVSREEPLDPADQGYARRACPLPVMTTWKLTIDRIQCNNPRSVQLLELISFLSLDDIPVKLLRDTLHLRDQSDVQFHMAFAPLLSFSLIHRLESSNFRMHSLVALCIRNRIASDNIQRRDWILGSLYGLLSDGFPRGMLGNHIQYLHLATHAAVALGHQQSSRHSFGFNTLLPDMLAFFLMNIGDAAGCLLWYQRILDGETKVLGAGHLKTPDTVHNIAVLFEM